MARLLTRPNARLVTATLTLMLTACGAQGESFWDRQADAGEALDSRSLREIVGQDLHDLGKTPDVREAAGPALSDAFGQVFDGYDGHAVRRYLDARLKHFIVPQDDVGVWPDPATFEYDKFLTPKGRSEPIAPVSAADVGFFSESHGRVAAANVGTSLWFLGVVNKRTITLVHNGQHVPLTSTRSGVMITGEGYLHAEFLDDRSLFYTHGPLERLNTLVHEARHSDCTGGFHAADVTLGQSARSSEEFFGQWKSTTCGHTHVLCKSGALEGEAACDATPWGAYSVGLVYLENIAKTIDPFSPEGRAAQAAIIDTRSRLEFSAADMMAGRLGPPDMSHTDARVH